MAIPYIIPIFCAFVSFLVVWFTTPWLIRYLKRAGLEVPDMNKKNKPLIPVSGGISVLAGFLAGIMVFVFFRTFFPQVGVSITTTESLSLLFAATISIIIITFVGFIDDIVITKNRERSEGLGQWQKPLLTAVAAVPLMVVNAGTKVMILPFFGEVNFGILYPLVLIPIGVVGAANMVNLLGGFNGVETGTGIIYIGMMGLFAFAFQRYEAALLALFIFGALLAFYYYNKFPARIFPGDSLTYLLGASLASIAIIGNMEKAALIISIPFFIEFILKARSRFKAQCYGYYKDGKICRDERSVYSLTHFFTRTCKLSEKQITYCIIFIQLIFAALIWVFKGRIPQ